MIQSTNKNNQSKNKLVDVNFDQTSSEDSGKDQDRKSRAKGQSNHGIIESHQKSYTLLTDKCREQKKQLLQQPQQKKGHTETKEEVRKSISQLKRKQDKFSINQIGKGLFVYGQGQGMDYDYQSQQDWDQNYAQLDIQDKAVSKKKHNQRKKIDMKINISGMEGGNKGNSSDEYKQSKDQALYGKVRNPNFRFYQTPRVTQKELKNIVQNNRSGNNSGSERGQSNEDSYQSQSDQEVNNATAQKKAFSKHNANNKLLQIDMQESESSFDDEKGDKDGGKSNENEVSRISEENISPNEQVKIIGVNVNQYMFSYLAKDTRLNATLHRDRTGLKTLWPQYVLKSDTGAKKQLLKAVKLKMSAAASYQFFAKENVQNFDEKVVAKMQANYKSNIYNLYVLNQKGNMQMKATIYFLPHVFSNTPRQFKVFILKEGFCRQYLNYGDGHPYQSYQKLYQIQENQDKIVCMRNKKPVWSQQFNGFILNFGGRVKKPSVKNFILQSTDTKEQTLMFGKTDEDCFNISISSPLNGILAFAICLTQFQTRVLE